MKIQGTNVLERNQQAKTRLVVNQGGTGSSKTFSLLQLIIIKALSERNKIFTVARKTFPALRSTVMKDFFSLLELYGLYDERNHSKVEHSYRLGSCVITFLSVDQAQKLRGRRHNYVYLNEANELSFEEFTQFNLRLRNPTLDGFSNQLFMDYNPSDEYHWIYDKILPREDCTFISSTYLDNGFLEEDTVKAIEELRSQDENYWRIYGLGERGISSETIFTNYGLVPSFPEGLRFCYGMDFGFNDPTTIVRVGIRESDLYWDEVLYRTGMTSTDIRTELKKLPPGLIYADPARPEIIRELELAGFRFGTTRKEIFEGINSIKKLKLHITETSTNLIKEVRSYKWKTDRKGRVLDEPIGLNDHAIDAGRYATYSQTRKQIAPARFNIKSPGL